MHHFYCFDTNLRFPLFLLYVKCKSEVKFLGDVPVMQDRFKFCSALFVKTEGILNKF